MLNYPIEVKKSKVAGKGAFAQKAIPAKRKLGNMAGEIISYKEAQRRVKNQKEGELLMVEFDNDPVALDASINRNELSYINHSCDPNIRAVVTRGHILYFSRRAIRKGEELLVDYHFDPDVEKVECKCGARSCRGTINLKKDSKKK